MTRCYLVFFHELKTSHTAELQNHFYVAPDLGKNIDTAPVPPIYITLYLAKNFNEEKLKPVFKIEYLKILYKINFFESMEPHYTIKRFAIF
jgi:hypothetical protein